MPSAGFANKFPNFWGGLWFIGIWEVFSNLLDPSDERCMMHRLDSFDSPKSHAIDIQFETLAFDLIAVPSRSFIRVDKLAVT